MCLFIDGFLKFIVYFYIELMNYTIGKSNSNFKFEYVIINNTNYSNLIKSLINLSDEEILEQVFQVFSMLSYQIFQRKDLM